jgi:hypothetical protein
MNAVKILYADGRVEDCIKKLSLGQMQEIVGGYIEVVKTTVKNRALIVNEEGNLKNLPENHNATEFVHPDVWRQGEIKGNAILVRSV